MRAGLFFAYWPWFSPEQQVSPAVLADELGLDSVWISEAWGQDAVSVLGLLAGRTERIALGWGLMQIPARQPTAAAMAAASLDVLSGGRFRRIPGHCSSRLSAAWPRPAARARRSTWRRVSRWRRRPTWTRRATQSGPGWRSTSVRWGLR
jgi:hypothetical protein